MKSQRDNSPFASTHIPTIRWIIVANQGEARFFEQNLRAGWIKLLAKFEHPNGRMKNQEIKEGEPGHSFSSWSGSHSRHPITSEVSPHDKEAENFAKQIRDKLEKARSENLYDELDLVAEPHFLGTIFAQLNELTSSFIQHKISKDLCHFTDYEVTEYLKEHLVSHKVVS
ncbi:MAG: host attachment protein [Oligoflexus sp.]